MIICTLGVVLFILWGARIERDCCTTNQR